MKLKLPVRIDPVSKLRDIESAIIPVNTWYVGTVVSLKVFSIVKLF